MRQVCLSTSFNAADVLLTGLKTNRVVLTRMSFSDVQFEVHDMGDYRAAVLRVIAVTQLPQAEMEAAFGVIPRRVVAVGVVSCRLGAFVCRHNGGSRSPVSRRAGNQQDAGRNGGETRSNQKTPQTRHFAQFRTWRSEN